MDKLPDNLSNAQKERKIKYLVSDVLHRKEKILENIGTTRYPIWALRIK